LGVKNIYASPIFKSMPGSTHGYDAVNPYQLNPEIRSAEQFRQIIEQLSSEKICWLQDIVPHHMAFHPQNEWLMDVLEKSKRSAWAYLFDIDWNSHFYNGKLMVPFLGNPVNDVLEKNELQVGYKNRRIIVKYFDAAYPLSPESYKTVLEVIEERVPHFLRQLLVQIQQILQTEDNDLFYNRWEEFLLQLSSLYQGTRGM